MHKKTVTLITISQFISYAIPLITFPILVKSFDISSYGIWIEASTIASLLISLGISGLSNALGVMIINKPSDEELVYANGLYLFLVVGIFLSIVLYLGAPYLNAITTRQSLGISIIQIVSCIPLINALQVLCTQVFRLRKKPFQGVALEIILVIGRLAACVIAAISHNLELFALVYIFFQFIPIIPFLIVAYHDIRLSYPSWIIIKETIKHSINLSLVSQANWLVMYGDRLMLSMLSVSAAVAIYSASYQLSLIMIALGWPYLYTLLPILGDLWNKGDKEGIQIAVRQATRGSLLLIIPAIVGLAATANVLLRVLATSAFAQGSLLVGMIALGVALEVIGGNLQYIFFAQGRPNIIRNIYLQAALFNLVANLIAIPMLSYNGAGLTTLITFMYIFYSLWRKTEMPFNALFDVSAIWRCIIVSGVMGIWVIATARPTIIGLVIAISGGAIIYGVGIIALKVISMDELLAIPRSILRRINRPKTV